MAGLACWSCGRPLETVGGVHAPAAAERRCPRCGAFLGPGRRPMARRERSGPEHSPEDPGSPDGERGGQTAPPTAAGGPLTPGADEAPGAQDRSD